MKPAPLAATLLVLATACASAPERAGACPANAAAIEASLARLPAARFYEGAAIAPETIRSDMRTWLDGVDALHPAPERRFDRAGLTETANRIEHALDRPMDQRQAWLLLAQLNPYFGDAHAGVLFPDRVERAQAHLDRGGRLFPLDVRIAGQRLVALADPAQEILSINGVPARDIAARMLAITEGDTLAFRQELASRRFALLYWLIFGDTGSYVAELRTGAGACSRVEVLDGARSIPSRALRDAPASSLYSYAMLPGGIAYLRAASFDGDHADYMQTFAREAFAAFKAQDARALIIDVRDNGGGDDELWMSNIMEHVAREPYRHVSDFAIRVTPQNADPGDVVGSISRGEYQRRRTPAAGDPLRFNGPVYVMVGPYTYSSAIVFAVTAQDAGVARIAGQETGGLACQTGRVTRIDMPGTDLNGFAPILSLTRPSGDAGCARGVVPDAALRSLDGDAGVQELAAIIRAEQSDARP